MRDSGSVLKTLRNRLTVITLFALFCAPLNAQQGVDDQAVSKATLELLLTRIDQLEARVKQLEAEKQRTSAVTPAPMARAADPSSLSSTSEPNGEMKATAQPAAALQAPSPSAPEPEPTQPENAM